MLVSTPERIAFSYELAGIGSRFLAQSLDALALLVLLAGDVWVAFRVGSAAGGRSALLVASLLTFVLVMGYFWVSEAVSAGRTLGKAALRIRVVGEKGEPVTFSQVAIRNLVRLVDFLPFLYGVGVVAAFATGRGQRLGDLAAGTVVVRERGRVSLSDLAPSPSAGSGGEVKGGLPPAPVPPELRRFVAAYSRRRAALSGPERARLAEEARAALERAMPDLARTEGPLAVLERLAAGVR